MRQPVNRQWHRCALSVGLVVAGACLLGGPPASAAEPNEHLVSGEAAAVVPEGEAVAAGQRIHVDPVTGRIVAPPPSAARAAIAADPAFSTSHDGLVVEQAPGGGVMVDLQGRFQSAVGAQVKPDGKVVVDCVPPGAAARER